MRQRQGTEAFIFFLTISILLLISGCVTLYNPATGRQESFFFSEEQEIAIGKNIAQDIIKKSKTITDKSKLSYLRNMGKKIGSLSHRPNLQYHFYILDDKEMSAFALPGGYMFVNNGLIDKTTEEELAFVLGHEIGHISARHSLKRLQSSLGINLLINIALRNPDYAYIKDSLNVVYNVVAMGYSRTDELLADSLGTKYIYQAGYNPMAAVNLLEKLQSEHKGPRPPVFLSSHPPAQTRIKNVRETLKTLK